MRWNFDFFAAVCFGACFCPSDFVPPPPRASAGVFIVKVKADATMASVAATHQRLVRGFFPFKNGALYMWSDRDVVRLCGLQGEAAERCGYCKWGSAYG